MDKGDDESFSFTLKNSDGTGVNLTGYTATMRIFWNEGRYPDSGYLVVNGGEINLTGTVDSNGNINFTLPSATSNTIPASGVGFAINNCQYVVKVTSATDVKTVIAGPMRVYIKGF